VLLGTALALGAPFGHGSGRPTRDLRRCGWMRVRGRAVGLGGLTRHHFTI
jgi:hypothetical protein